MQELFEIEWGQDFVGLGLSEAVPKFLRTNAKIKNRHMSKAHTSSLVFLVSHTSHVTQIGHASCSRTLSDSSLQMCALCTLPMHSKL